MEPMNREQFIQKVMRQLPGVPEPRILVRLPGMLVAPGSSPEQDAKQAAEHFQEPVAIASKDGELLAYHVPVASEK
jgi:hypothetical protein